MIFEIPDDACEREEQLLEEMRRKVIEEIMENYRKTLEERKNGIHKSFGEIMEELMYNDMGVEDQYYYDAQRNRRELFKKLKEQRPA
jgi:alanine-alpha-ketoisovalerate/valine-pyruvate aminotransferase